jgi:hypothetical protein
MISEKILIIELQKNKSFETPGHRWVVKMDIKEI